MKPEKFSYTMDINSTKVTITMKDLLKDAVTITEHDGPSSMDFLVEDLPQLASVLTKVHNLLTTGY